METLTALNVKADPAYATAAQLAVTYKIGEVKAKNVIKWSGMPGRVFPQVPAFFKFYHKERFGRELKTYNARMDAKLKKGAFSTLKKRAAMYGVRKLASMNEFPLKEALRVMKMAWITQSQWDAAVKKYELKYADVKCFSCHVMMSKRRIKQHEADCTGTKHYVVCTKCQVPTRPSLVNDGVCTSCAS